MGKKDKKDKKDRNAKGKGKGASRKKDSAKKALKRLHCTGCKKRCPLSDPKCKKGRAQAEAALADLPKK